MFVNEIDLYPRFFSFPGLLLRNIIKYFITIDRGNTGEKAEGRNVSGNKPRERQQWFLPASII